VYEILFHHIRNISTFSESFDEYNIYWLSNDWEKLIEDLSALSIIKIFETVNIFNSALLFSLNDVSETDKKFEKFIDNNNFRYQQKIVKIIKIW